MMKKLVVFILVIGLCPLGLQAKGFLKSRVDERMELLSVVMRLAGVPEYSRGMIPEYNQCVDEFFAAYQDHPVVTTARKMRRKYAFRRDAVLNLAVHLKIEGDSVFFDPALTTEGMDSRTNNELTPVFIRELDDFYKKTGANRFFSSVREFYRHFGEKTDEQVADKIRSEWFDNFFGWHASDFRIVQTLLIGEYSFYTTTVDKEGKEITYFSIRGFLDQQKQPSADWKVARSTVLWGMAHTYGDPLMDECEAVLKPYVKVIYKRMDREIGSWPYRETEAVLHEGFARGIEVFYIQFFDEDNKDVIGKQERQGYYWLGSFSDLLTMYAGSRDEYKTLRDFMPQIVNFYKELAR